MSKEHLLQALHLAIQTRTAQENKLGYFAPSVMLQAWIDYYNSLQ